MTVVPFPQPWLPATKAIGHDVFPVQASHPASHEKAHRLLLILFVAVFLPQTEAAFEQALQWLLEPADKAQ